MLNLLLKRKEERNIKERRKRERKLSHLRRYLIPTLHVTHSSREMRSESLKSLKRGYAPTWRWICAASALTIKTSELCVSFPSHQRHSTHFISPFLLKVFFNVNVQVLFSTKVIKGLSLYMTNLDSCLGIVHYDALFACSIVKDIKIISDVILSV